jgi:hypothetical protein
MHPYFGRSVPTASLPNLIPCWNRRKCSLNVRRVQVSRWRSFLLRRRTAGNVLLNALATALDQNDQHNYRKDAGNYSDKRYVVHIKSPFLVNEVFVKTLHYGDGRRTQSDQKQGGKYKQHKREDKFDGCLRCLLLHSLATLGSEGVRMNA